MLASPGQLDKERQGRAGLGLELEAQSGETEERRDAQGDDKNRRRRMNGGGVMR